MMKKLVLLDINSIAEYGSVACPDKCSDISKCVLPVITEFLKQECWDGVLAVMQPVQKQKERCLSGDHLFDPDEAGVKKDTLYAQMLHLFQNISLPVIEWKNGDMLDAIASICKNPEFEQMQFFILSNEPLMLQLVSERVQVAMPAVRTSEELFHIYDEETLKEHYGISATQIPDLFSLIGDGKSNLPGVSGCGRAIAAQWLGQFDNVEMLLQQADEKEIEFYGSRLSSEKEQIIKRKKSFSDVQTMSVSLPENCFEWNISLLDNDQATQEILEEHHDVTMVTEEIADAETLSKLYSDMEESVKNSQSVGICLIGEDESKVEKHREHQNNSFYAEPGGQYSLFAMSGQAQETQGILLGCGISLENKTMYIDCQQNWFQETVFVEKMQNWIEAGLQFTVLDGKQFLYQLDRLFQWHGKEKNYKELLRKCKFFDVSIAQYLLNPIQEQYEYEYFAKEYLNCAMLSEKEFLQKKSWGDQKAENREAFELRCCQYAWTVKSVEGLLKKQLQQQEMDTLYQTVELPLVEVLYEMEERGIRVNKDELKNYGEKLQVKIVELEQEIYALAGEEFNINSPKQLGVILFEKLQLPNGKKTKTGYSTSAEVLEKIKGEHEIVGKILEYRQLTKLKSTYADGLIPFIDETDGRIHCNFKQTITATGRLSCAEPNLQNIPIRMEIGREIRKVFVPREGYVFLDADYSQIELRILAHMSGDQSLIDAYNSGKDIHRITASEVFHTPFEEVTSLQRSSAKAVNFGIVYGMSAFGLAQDLNISNKEAQEYISRYFATYPGIKEFLDASVETGREQGYAVSLFGRRRPIPELAEGNKYVQRAFGERIAMNSPIQGTAADIIKIAMIRVNDRIRKEKLRSRLLLQIHDELLVETHPDERECVKNILIEEMSQVAKLSVPLEVEVKEGLNWNEAH